MLTAEILNAMNRLAYEQAGRFKIAAEADRTETEEGAVILNHTRHIKAPRLNSPVQGLGRLARPAAAAPAARPCATQSGIPTP